MIISILDACNDDGARNNGETGVDCGGGGCPDCGKLELCYFVVFRNNIFLILLITPSVNYNFFK